MNLQAALDELSNNPNMTTAQLKALAAQVDMDMGNATVKLAYSGYIGGFSPANTKANSYALSLKQAFGGNVAVIDDTDFFKFIENQQFRDALYNSYSGDDAFRQAQMRKDIWGEDPTGQNRLDPSIAKDSIIDLSTPYPQQPMMTSWIFMKL